MILLLLLILFGSCLELALNAPSPCLTPNSEKAHCVSLFSCSILQQALSSGEEMTKNFVAASKCGDDFMVCCGTVGNFTSLVSKKPDDKLAKEFDEARKKKETRRAYVLKHFAPSLKYCGYQHSDDHYNEGNNTAIDEFPWLIEMEYGSYMKNYGLGKCTAVLLSNRLVLTSSNCGGRAISNIRIGQYSKYNTTSCVTTSLFGTECSEPVIISLGDRQGVSDHDLILFKLTKPVTFSDYVRPICLPFQELQRPKVGDTVYTSGWGEGNQDGIKKKIAHEIQSYKTRRGIDEQIVRFGKGTTSKYVCEEDLGGPLMYSYKHQWFLTGIITHAPCNASVSSKADGLASKTLDILMDPIFNFLAPYPKSGLERMEEADSSR